MRSAFFDKQRENSFTNNGFHVVDLLNPTELEEVRNCVKEFGYSIDHDIRYRISMLQDSVDKKNEFFEKLVPVFQNRVDQLLDNYKVIRIGILEKLPDSDSLSFHQHPNLVDESKYCSLTSWVPLVDITLEMGALHVVKGSHKVFDQIRAPNYHGAFNNVSQKIKEKFSTPLLLNAGQTVIMNDRLIHWSPPNISSRIRTIIKLELIPREATLSFYYRVNKDELLHFELKENIYRINALFYEKPDGHKLIGKINQPHTSYRNRQFLSKMKAINPVPSSQKRNLFQKLIG